MFDIGALELLLVVVVAIIVIGPKDMPGALRMAGRWVGQLRRVSSQFRSGFDTMVREAEMEDMEKKWKEQNAKIMAEHPDETMEPLAAKSAAAESATTEKPAPPAMAADENQAEESVPAAPKSALTKPNPDEPLLPLGNAEGQ